MLAWVGRVCVCVGGYGCSLGDCMGGCERVLLPTGPKLLQVSALSFDGGQILNPSMPADCLRPGEGEVLMLAVGRLVRLRQHGPSPPNSTPKLSQDAAYCLPGHLDHTAFLRVLAS